MYEAQLNQDHQNMLFEARGFLSSTEWAVMNQSYLSDMKVSSHHGAIHDAV